MSYKYRFIPLFFALLFISKICLTGTTEALQPSREWNFLVYMSNNNNLYRYGMTNFRQMIQTGSNPNVNLLLQMDTLGQKEISRFYIDQNNAKLIQTHSNTPTSFSGTPINLYEFASWGSLNYPAQKTCLVLWNHGAGIKDPNIWGRMLMRWRDDLFTINKTTRLLELDRSLNTHEARELLLKKRGIAFNEAAEAYLTNDDLKTSLEAISKDCLRGAKIDVVAMDACHMAMIEVGSQIKNSVSIMVGSSEVEPGAGWNYKSALTAFSKSAATDKEIAAHFVAAYHAEYRSTTGDYTQSAVDLSYCNSMEANISRFASSMIDLMTIGRQAGFKVIRDLRFSRSATTEFFDTDYIDLRHLYKSVLRCMQDILNGEQLSIFGASTSQQLAAEISCKEISSACLEGLGILESMIIANASGRNLKEASGLSIYFPISSIHSSYRKTVFAKSTKWVQFLEKFLRMRFKESSTVATQNHTITEGIGTAEHKEKKACCDDCKKKGGTCVDEKQEKKKAKFTEKQKHAARHGKSPRKKGPCPCAPKSIKA